MISRRQSLAAVQRAEYSRHALTGKPEHGYIM